MGLLAPLALASAALSLPILIFYMLKLRREERAVSSTMLWQMVLRDREANSPWQRLRRNLLLLLQLLALALLVLALARPYSEITRLIQGNVIVLLDASASMASTDVSPSRFERARDLTRQMIEGLGPNDTMTLIAAGETPRVLASMTHDRSLLRRALSGARLTLAEADWEATFLLAASSAAQAEHNTLILLSDGGLPPGLPAVSGEVRYMQVGVTRENRALSALALRDGPRGPQGFVRVANYGVEPVTALVEVYADGALLDAREVPLPGGEERGIPLDDLPYDVRQIEARLGGEGEDALSVDDVAWAVRAPGERGTVLLATPGNVYLERALSLLPNVEPVLVQVTGTITNAQIPTPVDPPALTVYDGVLPDVLPEAGNLFFLAPPASTALFGLSGSVAQPGAPRVARDDPLMRYVDLDALHVLRAQVVDPPPWARTLIASEGGPLLLAGEVGGRRVAILAFDLHASDLPLQIAFPILISNLMNWLVPARSVDVPPLLQPGDPVLVRPPVGASEVAVTGPTGQRWTYPVEGSAPIPFAETGDPGVYRIAYAGLDPAEEREARFAVNLFSELESDIRPRDTIAVGKAPVSGEGTGAVARREWWRWVALGGLLVLLVEWAVHRRGWWIR